MLLSSFIANIIEVVVFVVQYFGMIVAYARNFSFDLDFGF
jgi:hypothetical protein